MLTHPQAPNAVVMIRPHHFRPNPDTMNDNAFQLKTNITESVEKNISALAYEQVSEVAKCLSLIGIDVTIFEDTSNETPDSVFPNNWFSTHAGGHVAIYPMYAKNRRKERRADVIEYLKEHYRVQDVVDYTGLEQDGLFLEGTGAMVLDHIERVAYAAKSKRTDSLILERFCTQFNYEPMLFDAYSNDGLPVYHTNVLMCIGSEFALAGFEMITDSSRRQHIIERLEMSGRAIIHLSEAQVNAFCGNALELSGMDGRVLALSETAFKSLDKKQIAQLEDSVQLLPLNVSALELAGGSIRCMLAGLHLSKR